MRKIFAPNRKEVRAGWPNYITESFIIITIHQINEKEMGGTCSTVREMRNARRTFVANLKGRDHLGDL
jgi:hypothetical protein